MMIEITEEITTYIGEKLFDDFSTQAEPSVAFSIEAQQYAFDETEKYSKWLTSPAGINAIKLAMVALEYNYHIQSNRYLTSNYECAFFDEFNRKSIKSSLESTAILLAAYHALKVKEAGY